MNVELLAPSGAVLSRDCREVSLPGIVGYMGIRKGHVACISSLKAGVLSVEDAAGTKTSFFVTDGLAKITPNNVQILSGTFEKSEDVDLDRARQAESRARERLAAQSSAAAGSIDVSRALHALEKAQLRQRFKQRLHS